VVHTLLFLSLNTTLQLASPPPVLAHLSFLTHIATDILRLDIAAALGIDIERTSQVVVLVSIDVHTPVVVLVSINVERSRDAPVSIGVDTSKIVFSHMDVALTTLPPKL
jgi:hypothetical protein